MFGISNSIKSRVVQTCTPERFWEVLRSPRVSEVCAAIADAWERQKRGEMSAEDFDELKSREKKRLPIFTFHATFSGGRRLNAEAVPSGLSMYDIDHLPNPRGCYETHIAPHTTRLGIVLAHVTPSTEGLRLVFAIPRGMDLAEAQRWMSAQLGNDDYDRSVKDLARSSFAVPEDYVLWVDEEKLFRNEEPSENEEPSNNEELRMKNEESSNNEERRTKNEESTGNEEPSINKGRHDTSTPKNSSSGSEADIHPSSLFKGVPYSAIIAQWFRLAGGEPVPGERNDKLHRLASHLRYITDNDEALLLRIMPRYGLGEEEMRALIHSACQGKWCAMPRMLRQALENEELRTKNEESSDNEESSMNEERKTKHEAFGSSPTKPSIGSEADILHASFPKSLPPLIDLLVSRTPDVYKPAVAHAVFPPLAAHLHRVTFRYIDNVDHEATLMNVLMAGTGAGKDCISEPINRIMADIRLRDAENLRREREWKQEVNSKGANKDKRQRPEGLVIQEIDADMTNPAFVMRTAEADGHFLYTKLNEIDQFDALRGSGRGGQQFQIMCLAFDPGNRYGQTRVGAQSVTEKVTIRFNWNAATTLQKGKRYFAGVLTDGPISRINFCTIPEREIGAEMPVYGSYSDDFDEALAPYIARLTSASGRVDCPQAFDLALRLRDENAEFARLSQSRVFENLSFRANVIAWLKACVLYVAHGYEWHDTFEEFIRWSLRYDLWCKIEFFGDAIEQAMLTPDPRNRRPGRRNLLTLLPDEFSLEDAIRVRRSVGLDAQGTPHMLSQWKVRGYITNITNHNYRKLKYRNDGIDIDTHTQA